MYALVDCNNFYCSCERVFDPGLEGRPVIVLSNNDGCAISRNDEAKAIGIEMGTPAFMIENEIRKHKIAVLSSNYTLYGDMSDRVMKTLESFCHRMEIFSIDEAYLDLHNMPYNDLLELGMRIRRTVRQHTGIPVSVGIAPTKTLAKMANRYAKKRFRNIGVFWAANEKLIQEMLRNTEVKDICGIGGQYARFLKVHGFNTAADFASAPEEWVRVNMSVVGQRLLNELRGIAASELETTTPAKKNITTSRSFGYLISRKEDIAEALSNYAANCALKLRQQLSRCRIITVFLETNPHRIDLAQYARSINIKVETPTNSTPEIIKYAMRGLEMIFKDGYQYLKTGIIVSELVPENVVQQHLFIQRDDAKLKRAMDAIDRLNKTLGRETVRMAVQGFSRGYRMRADHVSPRYTTDINDVIKVKN